MKLAFTCVACGRTATTSAASGAAGARKLKWKRHGLDYICDQCGKPTGRARIPARHVHAEGYKFDSETEYRYYLRLKERVRRGEIRDLEVHPAYTLYPACKDTFGRVWKAIRVKFDFSYTIVATGRQVADDVKAYESNDRAKVLLPIVQRLHPGTMFRFCDEWGGDWKPPKRKR